MASPTEFTLNADVFRLVADTGDIGADEDMPAITGLQLFFDPDLDDPDKLIPANISPRPIFIKPERVTGYIRSDGRMYDQPAVSAAPADLTDPGNIGVRLLASGAELNLVNPLTYTVSSNTLTIAGQPWTVFPWHIPAPATDVTVNLAALAPVSQGSGTQILRGPAGPGADAVRLSGGNVIFSYLGVDIPSPLAIASSSVPDGSVTTIKIVDANVTLPKLSAGVQTSLGKADTALQSLAVDSVGSSQIAADAVGSSEIAANAVGSSELADGAVDTAAILDANVTLPKLSAGVQTSLGKADSALQSVNTAAIIDGSVTLPKLAASIQTSLGKADTALQSLAVDSVGSSQIAANAVTSSELADNSVDTAAIIDANVTLPKHSAGVQTSLGKADTALQPGSTVAGDLTGTAAAPTVAKVNGVAVTGTPSVGQVPTATSSTAATWQNQAGGGGSYVDPLTTAGDIVVRGAAATVRKAVGTNTQVLRVNTANADKTEWATLTKTDVGLSNVDNTADVNKPVSTPQATAISGVFAAAVPNAVVDVKGDLIAGTGSDTVARLPVGTDTQVLAADSTQTTGLKWTNPTQGIPVTIMNAKGDLIVGAANDSPINFPITSLDGQVLTADSTTGTGLKWSTPILPPPPAEVFHDFTTKANGAPAANADSGQAWTVTYNRIGAIPIIASGAFTDADTAAGVSQGYLTAHLTGTTNTYMDCVFNFAAAGSTTGQAVLVSNFAANLASGVLAGYPDSSCQVVCTTNYVDYSVVSSAVQTSLGRYTFPTPLSTATNYHLGVTVDKAHSVSYVDTPDGKRIAFSNALIGSITAPYVSFSDYLTTADTDHHVNIRTVSGSSAAITSGGGGGGLGPDTVGWVELNAAGTGGTGKFLAIDVSNNLSAAVPAVGTVGADTIGNTELNASGTGGTGKFLALDGAGNMSWATPASTSIPGGTFSGWANVVVDYGADPTGSAECSAAFRNAQNTGKPIYVPPGAYNFNGAALTGNVFRVFGSGSYMSSINLGPGVRFIDTTGPIYNAQISGLRVNGGAGFLRSTYTGVNVNEFKIIEFCRFTGYTNCCIECNASDSPYWQIHTCQFWAANYTTSMGIALSGFNDSNSIRNCAFLGNRVHVKMQTGVTAKVIECDFLRFDASQGFPRTDFWLVPTTTSDPNAGQGFVMRDSKFGNENLEATDFRILFADQGSGTNFGDRFPVTTVASTGLLFSQQYTGINHSGGSGAQNLALITSMTPNVQGMVIGPVSQSGIGFQPLLRLFNANGYSHTTNVIGPLVGPSVSQVTQPAYTVVTSGTLSGQARSL